MTSARATRIVMGRARATRSQPLTVSATSSLTSTRRLERVYPGDRVGAYGFGLAITWDEQPPWARNLSAQRMQRRPTDGVRVGLVDAQVLAISAIVQCRCSGEFDRDADAQSWGADPMLKAFIICVVAGLGTTAVLPLHSCWLVEDTRSTPPGRAMSQPFYFYCGYLCLSQLTPIVVWLVAGGMPITRYGATFCSVCSAGWRPACASPGRTLRLITLFLSGPSLCAVLFVLGRGHACLPPHTRLVRYYVMLGS